MATLSAWSASMRRASASMPLVARVEAGQQLAFDDPVALFGEELLQRAAHLECETHLVGRFDPARELQCGKRRAGTDRVDPYDGRLFGAGMPIRTTVGAEGAGCEK